MTRLRIARQVLYYRSLRYNRAQIVHQIKRAVGKRWNKSMLEFIDLVIKHKGMPPNSKQDSKAQDVLAALAKKLKLKKSGKSFVTRASFASLTNLERKQKQASLLLRKAGFKSTRTSGDVGMWTHGFQYVGQKNLSIFADLNVSDKRKPYRLTLKLYQVRT